MLFSRGKTVFWILAVAVPLLIVILGLTGVYLGSLGMDIHWAHH